MKALVTGSNGFIGSFLVEKLLEQNFEVKCLVRRTSNLQWIQDKPVQLIYGDVTNFESVIPAVTDVDFVFHCGGIVRAKNRDYYFKVNCSGTKNLLESCKRYNSDLKRFVYLSSQAAVGPSKGDFRITEKDNPNPISDYGKSKLCGEQVVKEYQEIFPVTILRPPSVYGPRDDDILAIFKYVRFGIKPNIGKDEKKISIIHVSDLVRGIVLAALHENAINETFFFTNQADCSLTELMNLIANVIKKKGRFVRVPEFLLDIVAFINENTARVFGKAALVNRDKALEMKQRYWLVDSSKAEKLLGFTNNIKIEDGLKKTFQWYQQQKWM